MILGFKTQFNEAILNGTKIHTIRKGKRWKAGMSIQFYNHVRTKKMKKFREDGICVSVQDIEIVFNGVFATITIDKRKLGSGKTYMLAKNDGFKELNEFDAWFYKVTNEGKEVLIGQIIHFTDMKY